MNPTRLARVLAPALALSVGLPTQARPVPGGGQSQQGVVPDCIRTCEPHFTQEGITWECTLDCVVDSVELVFDLTAGEGDPYMPRFSSVLDCPPPCVFGDEEIDFVTGDIVPLRASLWAVPNGGWLTGQHNVSSVRFSVVPVVETLVEDDFDKLPWIDLGGGTEAMQGIWEAGWKTEGFTDPAGYLLRVDMEDTLVGTTTAITIARDRAACGHHAFGIFGPGSDPGSNLLQLEVSGGDSPGKSFDAITSGVTGSGAYTLISAGAVDLDFLGGRLWIDPTHLLAAEFGPSSAGRVTETFLLPPNPVLAGVDVYIQSFAEEVALPRKWAISNGVRTTICP